MAIDVLKAILSNLLVWNAGLNLIAALLFFFVPGFPKEIWLAIVTFVNAILGAIGIATSVRAVRMKAKARKRTVVSPS